MRHPGIMDTTPEKAKNNVRVLTKYSEYGIGRRLEKTGFVDDAST